MVEIRGVITVGAAAKELGVTRAWIRVLADRGTLPSTRTPLGRLLDEDAVRRFAAGRAQRRAAAGGAT